MRKKSSNYIMKFLTSSALLTTSTFLHICTILGFSLVIALIGDYEYFGNLIECYNLQTEYYELIEWEADIEMEYTMLSRWSDGLQYMLESSHYSGIRGMVRLVEKIRCAEGQLNKSRLLKYFYVALEPQWTEEGCDSSICPSVALARKLYPEVMLG